jgi:hypothetical protein
MLVWRLVHAGYHVGHYPGRPDLVYRLNRLVARAGWAVTTGAGRAHLADATRTVVATLHTARAAAGLWAWEVLASSAVHTTVAERFVVTLPRTVGGTVVAYGWAGAAYPAHLPDARRDAARATVDAFVAVAAADRDPRFAPIWAECQRDPAALWVLGDRLDDAAEDAAAAGARHLAVILSPRCPPRRPALEFFRGGP